MRITWIYAGLAAATAALGGTAAPRAREQSRFEEHGRGRFAQLGQAGDESAEARTKFEQFAQARTAPGIVLPGAYGAAFASLSGLPISGGTWTEVTNRPYNSDD